MIYYRVTGREYDEIDGYDHTNDVSFNSDFLDRALAEAGDWINAAANRALVAIQVCDAETDAIERHIDPRATVNVMTNKRDERMRELYRMPKRELAALYDSRHTFLYLAAPLTSWSKDELINAILDDEFGGAA